MSAEKVVSKISWGNPFNQQAAYTIKETTVCSHCALGPHAERAQVIKVENTFVPVGK